MLTTRYHLLLPLFLFASSAATAQLSDDKQREWARMHESKGPSLEEFSEAKFGLFIHWGLYSLLGAEWKGERIQGLPSWIMFNAMIPRSEYLEVARSFNPLKFDADAWVSAAKDAGMRYLVVTSKHHDGFALYRTAVNPAHSIAATPFKRDPIDELYRACKKHGLRFGVYYSHAIDWLDGWDGGLLFPGRRRLETRQDNPMNTWDRVETTRERYLSEKSFPQVKELVRKYPDMLEIWFDYFHEGARYGYFTPDISFDFYRIVFESSPRLLVSTRIGNKLGDFLAAGDNQIPTTARMPYWETPGTINNVWGFSKFDHDWKSTEELLFWLVEIASKGGNYLLNVGPKADGTIPSESLDRLAGIGRWMKVNGESIYGTMRWLVDREGTTKPVMKGTTARAKEGFAVRFTTGDFWFTTKRGAVFVNAFVKPADGPVIVKTLAQGNPATNRFEVKSVRLLGYPGELGWKQTDAGLEVQLPKGFQHAYGYCLEVRP